MPTFPLPMISQFVTRFDSGLRATWLQFRYISRSIFDCRLFQQKEQHTAENSLVVHDAIHQLRLHVDVLCVRLHDGLWL